MFCIKSFMEVLVDLKNLKKMIFIQTKAKKQQENVVEPRLIWIFLEQWN
jgi:hypothetical protein